MSLGGKKLSQNNRIINFSFYRKTENMAIIKNLNAGKIFCRPKNEVYENLSKINENFRGLKMKVLWAQRIIIRGIRKFGNEQNDE